MEGWTAEKQWAVGDINCTHGLREFNEHTQKRVYTVGVHAPSGIEKAWLEFNMTFESYLTEVVGKRFDPLIEFKMEPSEWPLLDWIDNAEDVDFMYSDTGLYSCIGTEIGAQPLATTIASLESRGNSYELDIYGVSFFFEAVVSPRVPLNRGAIVETNRKHENSPLLPVCRFFVPFETGH